MSIIRTDHTVNLTQILVDLDSVLQLQPWPEWNQIGLRHRPEATDLWLDAHGSLYDKQLNKYTSTENDFSVWNSQTPKYTKDVIEDLARQEGFKIGRVRYMRQMPKNGLSVHFDSEQRYHLVLETNSNAMFGFKERDGNVVAKCYHVPADGFFYKVDTTKEHFVYNGGWEPRIHLVICAL
jgi:hypothetical protein